MFYKLNYTEDLWEFQRKDAEIEALHVQTPSSQRVALTPLPKQTLTFIITQNRPHKATRRDDEDVARKVVHANAH